MPTEDGPRDGLIVQVARELGDALSQLCERPRKLLRRVREKTHVGRAQQLDAACLQWLVRQPGRTASEKAGSRQQVLAVIRQEDFNTLENRVLKDMLRRCEGMAARWLHANRRHSQHKTFVAVSAFRSRCRRDLRADFLVTVPQLVAMPQPNYVLRHSADYRKLWDWYCRIVAQESETDAVWPWQHRLWEDAMRVYLVAAVTAYLAVSGVEGPMNHALWLGRRAEAGRWTTPFDWPGPAVLRSGNRHANRDTVVECMEPNALSPGGNAQGLSLAESLGCLGASFAVRFSALNQAGGNSGVCLLLWAVHCPMGTDDAVVQGFCEQALRSLELTERQEGPSPCLWRGLVLVSDPLAEYRTIDDYQVAAASDLQVLGVRVQGSPDEWQGDFMTFLWMVVEESIRLVH